ncbi:MAG TPA: hypothetical protein PK087_00135 [Bacilli bacterium]|nr:MAG: hypothetical protein BWY97_00845 [Tenericutes bacterium ADurb.BinA124]HNZ49907.1 hypothetical protein [Bacilli bacterium]HOH17706.1 hypothetical protein [Bacilli bacterium]HPX84222.1 hypothetical protein [Bacilli bacterium]HQC74147.1 hypothetical protein [Bacilli bacterium]
MDNKYREILNELYEIYEKINAYQEEALKLQNQIGERTNSISEQLDLQTTNLSEFKEKILGYINEFSNKLNDVSNKISTDFQNTTQKRIDTIKLELSSEVGLLLKSISKTFAEVYGNLNKDRIELINKLNENLELNKNEGNVVKDITTQLEEQNKYLAIITKESKNNISKHLDETKYIKEELELLKQNFELKYVYNKKRIIFTSIFSLIMIIMISSAIFASIYMIAYYLKLIFFPNRIYTLVIGILLLVLSIGLIAILALVIFNPPTFLKKNKQRKGKNE